MTTVAAVLTGAAESLLPSSESPRADAALILAHVLRRDRSWLVAHSDAALGDTQVERFNTLCARRRDGVPIAYLIGSAGFYGRQFLVDEAVLVPRPETEHLVDEAIAFLHGAMRALDVGTGCGAIACTIAAETDSFVHATDASRSAVDVAVENARRLGLSDRCRFYHGDLVEPVRTNRYDLIVANLPYIPTADLPRPPDPASFEPRGALDGGPDGLVQYRRLIAQLPAIVRDEALVLLEAAAPTIDELQTLVNCAMPSGDVRLGRDYSGSPRYLSIRLK